MYTSEFYRSLSFKKLMFDTVTDFYLFIFNVFTTEPFWTLWWQPPGEKQSIQANSRQRAEGVRLVETHLLLISQDADRSL